MAPLPWPCFVWGEETLFPSWDSPSGIDKCGISPLLSHLPRRCHNRPETPIQWFQNGPCWEESAEKLWEKRREREEGGAQGQGGDSWRGPTLTKPLPQGWAKGGWPATAGRACAPCRGSGRFTACALAPLSL